MARQVQVSYSSLRCHEMEPKLSCNLLPVLLESIFCFHVWSGRVKVYLTIILVCLTLVYLISPMCTCLTPPPPLPLFSAQDYCLPVHRLHGGTDRPGSKCYP